MKYRLKDKDLQKNLDEISGGRFSELVKLITDENFNRNKVVEMAFGEPPSKGSYESKYVARFDMNEFEPCQEYDPKAWNNYPEVTPPEGVWMRCERPNDLCVDGIERMCLKYMVDEQGGFWTDDCESGDLGYENMRFRPWED